MPLPPTPRRLARRTRWWGGRAHRIYTVVVLVVLASLDNTALRLLPPLFGVAAEALEVSEAALGIVSAATMLVTAVTAVGWGYVGDRGGRKPLLVGGTLLWVGGMAASGYAPGFAVLAAAHVLAGIGMGAVASVGFAVVSDLISPRRRGLAMSFWGMSQGIGSVAGTLVAGILGADNWRVPFVVLAAAGGVVALLFVFAVEIPRGASEPELEALFAEGEAYPYRIRREDLPALWRRRTNVWLVVQGLTAQVAYGSLIWLPRLFQAKVAAAGVASSAAVVVGSVFASMFQLGGVFSVLGGWLGDRFQQRTLRARPVISAVGILGAVPFFLMMFFFPLRLDIPPGASRLDVIAAALTSVFTNPTVAATFGAALFALALTSLDSPNWFALIGDVNLPEHRGTVFGAANLVNGVGQAAGNGLVGLVFLSGLLAAFPPPLNFAVGLAAFQVFYLPTGYAYWRASKTAPGDIVEVREALAARGRPQAGG